MKISLSDRFLFYKGAWVGWSRVLISIIALAYIVYLTLGLFFAYLGPNPIEVLTHATGEWGLYFLLLTLAITPLRRHYHWNSLQKFRRFFGLWSFTFIFLHFFVFIFFDHFFDIASIFEDIVERPYIAVGFIAFILMIPLAVTSYKTLQKKMGKRWISLHQSIYLVSILGVIHYWWLVKADILLPLVFAVVLTVLLGDRLYWRYRKQLEKKTR